MELVSSDKERGLQTPVWKSYQSILLEAGCSVSVLPPPRTGWDPLPFFAGLGGRKDRPPLCPMAV